MNEVLSIDPTAQAYPWHSNYSALPGPGYFIQCSYEPGKSTNLGAAMKAGMIPTVNFLNGGKIDDLLKTYPDVRVIQSDISDDLIPYLKGKGLR